MFKCMIVINVCFLKCMIVINVCFLKCIFLSVVVKYYKTKDSIYDLDMTLKRVLIITMVFFYNHSAIVCT